MVCGFVDCNCFHLCLFIWLFCSFMVGFCCGYILLVLWLIVLLWFATHFTLSTLFSLCLVCCMCLVLLFGFLVIVVFYCCLLLCYVGGAGLGGWCCFGFVGVFVVMLVAGLA